MCSSLAFILTSCFSLAMAISPPLRSGADLDETIAAALPAAVPPVVVNPSQRLLLVFQRADNAPGAPTRYRVVHSSADAAFLARRMNEMAAAGYRYRSVIGVPPVPSPAPAPIPHAVGVPGVTSNVLGQGSVRGVGEVPAIAGKLLLTFSRAEGRNPYIVLESSSQPNEVQRRMNAMARRRLRYHTAAPLSDAVVRARVDGGARGYAMEGLVDDGIFPNARAPVVETPWVRRPGTPSEYRVIHGGTWAECEAAAVEQGAHLVTINDAHEQAWLTETYRHPRYLWIGFTDEGSEGVWRWTSGEDPGYTNWAAHTNEPSNQWGGEHFAHMNWGEGGQWNDLGPASGEWRIVTHGIIERPVADE